MADHLKPTLTSNYSSFVTELDGRFDDLAVGLDPAVTTATNVPTNSIRWSSAVNKWQKYNGTSWADLTALYNISISGNSATVTNGVYTTGSYANPAWITSLAGSKITGDIAGNAGSATRLATARNINGVAFDGTAAISVNLNNSVTFNNAGTGATSGSTFNGGTGLTVSYNTIGAPSTTGANASGTWGISISGNAATVTNGVYNNGGTYGINISGNAASVTNGVYNNGATYNINISGNSNYANSSGYATSAGNGGVTSVNGLTGAVVASTFGINQSWQSVSLSNNVTYTNNTGGTIMVAARNVGTGGFQLVDEVYVNGNRIIYAAWDAVAMTNTYVFIVPNGQTYRVNYNTGLAEVWILKA